MARTRCPVSARCLLETTSGAAMNVFCVNTAAAVAAGSERINAKSSAPPGLIPAATADVLNPSTNILLSVGPTVRHHISVQLIHRRPVPPHILLSVGPTVRHHISVQLIHRRPVPPHI